MVMATAPGLSPAQGENPAVPRGPLCAQLPWGPADAVHSSLMWTPRGQHCCVAGAFLEHMHPPRGTPIALSFRIRLFSNNVHLQTARPLLRDPQERHRADSLTTSSDHWPRSLQVPGVT